GDSVTAVPFPLVLADADSAPMSLPPYAPVQGFYFYRTEVFGIRCRGSLKAAHHHGQGVFGRHRRIDAELWCSGGDSEGRRGGSPPESDAVRGRGAGGARGPAQTRNVPSDDHAEVVVVGSAPSVAVGARLSSRTSSLPSQRLRSRRSGRIDPPPGITPARRGGVSASQRHTAASVDAHRRHVRPGTPA